MPELFLSASASPSNFDISSSSPFLSPISFTTSDSSLISLIFWNNFSTSLSMSKAFIQSKASNHSNA